MVVEEKGEGGGKHQGVFILFFLYSTLGSFEGGKKRFKKACSLLKKSKHILREKNKIQKQREQKT